MEKNIIRLTESQLHNVITESVKKIISEIESSESSFNNIDGFKNGFAMVERNDGKVNYINREGYIISRQWFDDGCDFENGFAEVELNGRANYINTEGTLISNDGFDVVYGFSEGYSVVALNNMFNYIDTKGNIISKQWFNDANDFENGFGGVELDGNYNLIDGNGKLLSNKWLYDYENFDGNGFKVQFEEGGKMYYMDRNGNIAG